MAMSLHPFAARIRISVRPEVAEPSWPELLTEIFSTIARRSRQVSGSTIGHIKGIAWAGDAFVRINCVSEHLPPDLGGNLPAGVRDVDLDLAMLVFGLEPEVSQAIVEAALQECCSHWPNTCLFDIARIHHGQSHH